MANLAFVEKLIERKLVRRTSDLVWASNNELMCQPVKCESRFGLNANVVAVAQGSIQVLRYDVHQKYSATTTQMWTIITLQSAQTKATVSAQSCFDAMFVFNITRSWRDLSTQENFRRKEKFEVKIFNF